MTTYYVIHDQDDHYVSDFDHADCVWVPSSEDPKRFDTLMDAVGFIEAHGLDTDVVEVQIVTPPVDGATVRVTSSGTWLGEPLRDRLGVVESSTSFPEGILARVHLIDGFRQTTEPEWVYLWGHEFVAAQLRPCSEAARAERRGVAA